MSLYFLSIKSHAEAPDWEQTIRAINKYAAVERFYKILHGEFGRKWIWNNVIKICKNPVYTEGFIYVGMRGGEK